MGTWPGLMLPNETVTDSPGFIFMLLESSPILSVPMFASSCAFDSAGIVAGSNATLWGPPLDDDELDTVALLDGDVGGLETIALRVADHLHFVVVPGDRGHRDRTARGVRAGVVVVVVTSCVVSTATWVVSAGFFSPPAQAPSAITPTATANP